MTTMTLIKMVDLMTAMHKTTKTVFSLFLFLLLSSSVYAAETVLTAADADGSTATLTLSSKPVLTMTMIDLNLTINKAHGDTLLPTSAVCDLTMPAMPMPRNRPVLECGPVGCSGTAIFTMAGEWDVICEVTFPAVKLPSCCL